MKKNEVEMRIKSLEDKVKQEEKYELFGDDLDIVDIYENCLKGFKYEKWSLAL